MGRARVTGKRKLTQRQKEIEESKSAPNGSNTRDEHIEPNNDKMGKTRAAKKKKLAQIQKEIEESESAPKCYNARVEHIESDNNVRHEDDPRESKNIAIQTAVNFENNGARTEGSLQAAEDNAMQTEVNVDAVMDKKIGKGRDMKKKKLTRKQKEIEGSKSALKVSNAMAKLIEPDNDVRNEDDPHASKNSASLTIKMGRTSDMKKKLSCKQKEIEEPKFAPKGSKSRDEHIELDEDVLNEGSPQTSKNNAIQMTIDFENSGARTKDNPQAFEDDTMQTEEKYKAVMDKKRGKSRGRAKKKKNKTQSTPKGSNVRNEHIGLSNDVRNEDNPHAFKYNAAQTEVNSENNNAQVQYDPQSFEDNAVQTVGSFEPVMEIEELIQDMDKNQIEKERNRGQRGPTKAERLYFDLASRIKVEFNAEGVPIGPGSVKLSSYLGPLARKHVPVTLNDWRRVGDELKAVMWESIQLQKMVRARVTGKRKLTQRQKEIEESKSAPNGSNARDEHIEPNNDKMGRTRAAKKKKLAQIQKEIEESESTPKCNNARDEHIKSDNNVRHEGNPRESKNIAIKTAVNFENNGARTEGSSQAAEDNAMQTEANADAGMDKKIGKGRDMKKKKLTRKQKEIEGSKSAVKVSNAMAKLIEPDNDVRNEDDPHASKNSASLTVKMGRTSDMKKKLSHKQKEFEEPKFAPKGSKSRDEHIELDEDVPNEGNSRTSKNNAIQMIIDFENNGARTKDNPQAFEDDTMQTEEKYKAVMDKKRDMGRGRAKKKKKTQSTPKGSNVRNERIGLSNDVRNEDNPHAFKYNAAQTEVNSENNNAQVQYDLQSFEDNAVQTVRSFEPVMEIEELIQDVDKNRIEKKRTRGPTTVERLYFDLVGRIKVEFNAEGVPIGAGSVKLSSYLGPLVRKHVPVTLNNWRCVGDELKAVLWESIQANFKLDKEWQKKVIFQQMGCIWRASKCRLVRKIIKAKSKEERSKLKPDNVESMEWNKFVESKTSLNFKTLSDKYRAMRSNQIFHTCGRKGMARLAEELKEKSVDPSSISRAQVWIRSRTRKTGEPVSMTVADTIEKIKQIENESESNLAIDVKENALSQLLGQDRWGKPTVRCKALTDVTSSHAKDKQIAQFQSRILELEGIVHMVMKNQGKEILREESIPQMSKCGKISEKCDLLDWGETDEIVAEGRVVSSDPNELVHKVPLGPNAMKILILVSKKSDAFLWRPTPSLTYIGDAEDRIVAWPTSRVVLRTGKTISTDKKCKLYDWSGSEELVAEGRLCSSDPKHLVNDIPLGPSAMAIWVDDPKNRDVFLWRPTSGMTFVGEAVGKKVAWPKSNVAIENLNVVASLAPTLTAAISHTNAEKQNAFLGKPTSGIINFGEAVSRKAPSRKSNVLGEKFNSVGSPTMNATVSPMTTNMMAKNKCKLIDLSGTGEIVAEGHVLSTNPKALVHFIPLGRNAVKVMVDFVKVPNAVLWRPSSELEYMEDAIGTTIAWPTTNVIMESISDN